MIIDNQSWLMINSDDHQLITMITIRHYNLWPRWFMWAFMQEEEIDCRFLFRNFSIEKKLIEKLFNWEKHSLRNFSLRTCSLRNIFIEKHILWELFSLRSSTSRWSFETSNYPGVEIRAHPTEGLDDRTLRRQVPIEGRKGERVM